MSDSGEELGFGDWGEVGTDGAGEDGASVGAGEGFEGA